MRKILIAALLISASSGALHAQTAPAEPTVERAPAKAVEDLISIFEREITSVANAMPADKYDFSPASLKLSDAKFSGVRTFAEELKHVVQSNYLTAAGITGTDPDVDIKKIGTLQTKAQILAALKDSFVAVHKAVATITPANENAAVDDPGVGPNQSKISEAAWVAVHGFDHYGQMVEYLRMNGIAPPPVPPAPTSQAN